MIEDIKEAGKIDLAQRAPNWRHDDAVNQRGDDLAKGRADNYRDCEVDDISTGNEFLEFFEHLVGLLSTDTPGQSLPRLYPAFSAVSLSLNVRRFVSGTLSASSQSFG